VVLCLSLERRTSPPDERVPVHRPQRGYGSSSVIRDRSVDLIFLDEQLRPQISKDQCRERIDTVHQDGERRSRLIGTMGYEILLLMPPEATDNG
jgi:hypothetical protein